MSYSSFVSVVFSARNSQYHIQAQRRQGWFVIVFFWWWRNWSKATLRKRIANNLDLQQSNNNSHNTNNGRVSTHSVNFLVSPHETDKDNEFYCTFHRHPQTLNSLYWNFCQKWAIWPKPKKHQSKHPTMTLETNEQTCFVFRCFALFWYQNGSTNSRCSTKIALFWTVFCKFVVVCQGLPRSEFCCLNFSICNSLVQILVVVLSCTTNWWCSTALLICTKMGFVTRSTQTKPLVRHHSPVTWRSFIPPRCPHTPAHCTCHSVF